VIDPYATVNARLRDRRRAQGRRDDEYDRLIRAVSQELGAATEAALGLFADVAERVGLRYLEEAARRGATRRLGWAPHAVRAVRSATARLPAAGGRAVGTSAEFAVRTALTLVRELRGRLEARRRRAAHGRPRAGPPPGQPPPGPGPGEGGRAPGAGRRKPPRRSPGRPGDGRA
jgi:hypothetical protein